MFILNVYEIEPMSVGKFLLFGLCTTTYRLYCFYSTKGLDTQASKYKSILFNVVSQQPIHTP